MSNVKTIAQMKAVIASTPTIRPYNTEPKGDGYSKVTPRKAKEVRDEINAAMEPFFDERPFGGSIEHADQQLPTDVQLISFVTESGNESKHYVHLGYIDYKNGMKYIQIGSCLTWNGLDYAYNLSQMVSRLLGDR